MATEAVFVRVCGPERRRGVVRSIVRTILLIFSLRWGQVAEGIFRQYRAYRIEYSSTYRVVHYRFEAALDEATQLYYRYRAFQYLDPVGDGGGIEPGPGRSSQWYRRLDLLPPPGSQATVCTWIRRVRSRVNTNEQNAIVNAARVTYIRETLDATYPDHIFP